MTKQETQFVENGIIIYTKKLKTLRHNHINNVDGNFEINYKNNEKL